MTSGIDDPLLFGGEQQRQFGVAEGVVKPAKLYSGVFSWLFPIPPHNSPSRGTTDNKYQLGH